MAREGEESLHEMLEAAFEEESSEDSGSASGDSMDEKISGSQKQTENQGGSHHSSLGDDKENGGMGDGTEDDSNKEDSNGGDQSIKAPDHWAEADKQAFSKASPEVKEWALRRDKEMTADYTRKTQEIAEFRKHWQPLHDMFSPYISQGVQVAPLIQGWAQVAQHLQQNPKEALLQLAKQHNVDLTPQQADDIWSNEQPQNVNDPRVADLQKRVETLTGHLQQRDQMEQQTRLKTFENDIQQFAQQKTESGDPAHPYFDELLNDMVTMARAMQAQGMKPELKDLYEKALWANPSTREKHTAAQQKAAAKAAEQEAIAKAKKAKQASKSVGGSPGAGKLEQRMSLRDMIESQFD